MKLSGSDCEKLLKCMVEAYPNKSDLEQMVRFYLEESLDAIAKGQTTKEIIYSLINDWAEPQGKLQDLLNAVSQDRPHKTELQETVNELLQKYFLNTLDNREIINNNPEIQRNQTVQKIQNQPIITSNSVNMSQASKKILHLSDLHFGTSEQAKLWAGQLVEDLQHNLDISELDGLILSGDIANKSTSEEYESAKQFLDEFIKDFSLKTEQILIVPGNHDLNWDLSKKAYTLKDKDECNTDELQEGYYIPVSDDVVRVLNPEKYPERFTNFKDFYDHYKASIKEYSLDAGKQYSIDIIGDNILILGLNSAWQLDHHYKSRATINNTALTNALNEIRRNNTYRNCPLKIAVWHHPINSPFEDRIKDSDFLQRLAVNDFNLFLHGHVHKAENDEFRYDLNVDGRKLHRICAGTFGAPTKELNTGIPWQYNLLKIESDKVIVHTRKREAENGAWEGDFRWRYGKNKTKDYYEIDIQSIVLSKQLDKQFLVKDIKQSSPLIIDTYCNQKYKLINLKIMEVDKTQVEISIQFPYGSVNPYPHLITQVSDFRQIYEECEKIAEEATESLLLNFQTQESFGSQLYSKVYYIIPWQSKPKKVFPDKKESGLMYSHQYSVSLNSILCHIYRSLPDEYYLNIQLNLSSNSKKLFKVPWEFIYQGDELGFLSASNSITFSRVIDVKKKLQPLEFPIKILLIFSDPPTIGNLGCEHEKNMLINVIKSYEERGIVSIETLNNPSVHELKDKIYKNYYHLIHYSGLDSKLFAIMSKEGNVNTEGIVLLNDSKTLPKVVDYEELAQIFENQNSVRLFVLNTCYTSEILAPALVKIGVPSVVSMQFPISVEASSLFPQYFYSYLLRENFAIDIALSQTRFNFYMDNKKFGKNRIDWVTPVLTTSVVDGDFLIIK